MADRETDRRPGSRNSADEVSVLGLANSLLRHRYLTTALALTLASLGALTGVVGGRSFTSTFSFVPQGIDGQEGRLSALAGQFGFDLPITGGAGESPAFYRELIFSREVLSRIAGVEYQVHSSPERSPARGDLARLLEVDAEEEPVRLAEVMEWLRSEAISVETDTDAGLVEVWVRTPWPDLSFGISRDLLEAINMFNLEARRSQAAAEREFVEERLAEARDSLLMAEGRLEDFLLGNRQFGNSPELAFRHDRLQRQVARRQQVVTSLAQAFEEARIREVRNTPVITIVDGAEMPLRPDPRNIPARIGIGLGLGLLLGGLVGVTIDLFRREEAEGSWEAREFARLWAGLRQDLRRFRGG